MKNDLPMNFETAFKYPFNRAKGMLNILWMLLPFIGWFALLGYVVRIVQEFVNGKFQELPLLSFKSDLKLGFFMFLKALPFMIAYNVIISIFGAVNLWLSWITQFILGILIIPMLTVNFLNKETVASYFEFKILKNVFNNLGDYLLTILKGIALGLIFLVMWLVLVGIPAGAFTQYLFLADFYRRKIK